MLGGLNCTTLTLTHAWLNASMIASVRYVLFLWTHPPDPPYMVFKPQWNRTSVISIYGVKDTPSEQRCFSDSCIGGKWAERLSSLGSCLWLGEKKTPVKLFCRIWVLTFFIHFSSLHLQFFISSVSAAETQNPTAWWCSAHSLCVPVSMKCTLASL